MIQQFKTQGGILIECTQTNLAYPDAIDPLLTQLNRHRGALFTSSFEYPGRYTCWDIGFYNPPLVITCTGNQVCIEALNCRGEVLLEILRPCLFAIEQARLLSQTKNRYQFLVQKTQSHFSEEERSRQPSIFTVIRSILHVFKSDEEPYLGLYGAFGYDLIFQFESLEIKKERAPHQRDMVLYLPDEIYIVNHRKEAAWMRRYDFECAGKKTRQLAREGESLDYEATRSPAVSGDHRSGEYADVVRQAKKRFACGDLFEVVPSQTFYRSCDELPASLFERMKRANPSPYGFMINLGELEYLIGASPEMYVRVQGDRVETCPISGTIKRGFNAIEDAEQIEVLLASEKDRSELTMCTDVDRNDKSRICQAGSVKVVGRRQIEVYSRLIHTVDHVEGYLRPGHDAIDAFLTHMWVVTVTGAPKLWAMNFIEQHEKSPRKWYGGAVGWFNFNGHINTGLVLRTIRLKQGIAEVRVGATLLFDSDPVAEEEETRLKASALLELLQGNTLNPAHNPRSFRTGLGKKVLLIDHQDSFVHTLANYLRQTGAEVITIRSEQALTYLKKKGHDLIVLSPGPGRPDQFDLNQTIREVLKQQIPLFGVCLGLQGIVEYFGGQLSVLDYPMHGKTSTIYVRQNHALFSGLGDSFEAGRYHSLYAKLVDMPNVLQITAETGDGIVMALSHQTLPIHAVQFHPETILSLPKQAGMQIISNLMGMVEINAQ